MNDSWTNQLLLKNFSLIKSWWLYNAVKNVLGFWQLLPFPVKREDSPENHLGRPGQQMVHQNWTMISISEASETWWCILQLDIIKLGYQWCTAMTTKIGATGQCVQLVKAQSQAVQNSQSKLGSIWGLQGSRAPYIFYSIAITLRKWKSLCLNSLWSDSNTIYSTYLTQKPKMKKEIAFNYKYAIAKQAGVL